MNTIPFNPLDKTNLGTSVVEALLKSEKYPLGDIPETAGAGIYAIYYKGSFDAYSLISSREIPIYVGKAVPSGSRKGIKTKTTGKPLYDRITEHAESINAASNLSINDFEFRFIIVDEIWIPLGESLIITRYTPVWNSVLDGFGAHDPGKGRYGGKRPRWDVVHPGREWAPKCKERPETADTIISEINTFLQLRWGR